MRDLGAGEIDAVVGPSVCGRCYEVPAEMRDAAAAVQPVSATVSWTGTPAIDVAAGVVAQLRDAGVEVRWVPGLRARARRPYSYRRDGPTGRFAGVVAAERVVSAAPATASRRAELAAWLDAVHDRIRRAVAAAGRTDEPALVVVTKFFPATDVDLLAELGVTGDR